MTVEFETLEKGQQIGERRIEVSRADLVAYAGASGDMNPIHWNEAFARSVGLPNVIAHGMFTMGAAVGLVTEWAGDPGAVVDYQTRFTKPVVVPNAYGTAVEPSTTLTVSGVVGALDAEARTARVDLAVTAPDLSAPDADPASAAPLKVLVKAQAVVRFPH
ncbi:acyl dehydratase [Kocuria rhizophila]|uniref:Beta-hydroxyacyl-[acyl-carrier-protein] dehydratase subunit HadB n=1 Tax=Kocuria rhizophila (strain ATCC 9341 / DSM 348 / NBRC 103217 / DC2201) TaxID=378753 RepID=B2GI54_KOCRD|nr:MULTISPECIES: MaoC family dehydratase [Kocuria]HBH55939.1 acyl dehydratase [Kocuria sp.]ASE11119.1 acyl dehydratase [Kocuria rhizophila]MBK4121466.1 MaoC family dehydratase [Kocuria rhizophila]MCC5671106.1 MaoC family dehydratase [Kocuria rhizophila]MCC5675296.1 MaoC family dehydratase [Kocuria rhizophila]